VLAVFDLSKKAVGGRFWPRPTGPRVRGGIFGTGQRAPSPPATESGWALWCPAVGFRGKLLTFRQTLVKTIPPITAWVVLRFVRHKYAASHSLLKVDQIWSIRSPCTPKLPQITPWPSHISLDAYK